MPTKKSDLPGTLKRSPAKAQRTYAKTLDSAEESYDSTERAHRAAWNAVKHSFEKVGDHWEPKDEKGPSDPRAASSTATARREASKSYGGVDFYGHTKAELYERAKRLGVEGRSRMDKGELADAIARAERNASRRKSR